jgi:AcrR family transcriptional regulator
LLPVVTLHVLPSFLMNHLEPAKERSLAPKPVRAVPRSPKPRATRVTGQTAQMSGAETRARILEAAQETLRLDGITQASARNIARRGDFNQALIFYHFGSVEGLLIAVAKGEGQLRAQNYEAQFGSISRLSELVTAARAVHAEELAAGGPTILTQLLAGSLSSEPLASGILEAMQPWMHLVEQAIRSSLGSSPLALIAPFDDVAFATASMFIGMELLTSLEPESGRAERLLDSFAKMAALIETAFLGRSPGSQTVAVEGGPVSAAPLAP